MTKEIKKGSTVKLKSDSCPMTVEAIKVEVGSKTKVAAKVVWYNGQHFDRDVFSVECLEVVK